MIVYRFTYTLSTPFIEISPLNVLFFTYQGLIVLKHTSKSISEMSKSMDVQKAQGYWNFKQNGTNQLKVFRKSKDLNDLWEKLMKRWKIISKRTVRLTLLSLLTHPTWKIRKKFQGNECFFVSEYNL